MEDVYTVPYRAIHAVVSEDGDRVELVEFPQCFGGAFWAQHHYSQRSNVISSKVYGDSVRYLLEVGECDEPLEGSYRAAGIERVELKEHEVEITYVGLGGGGIGATVCRALADGVRRYQLSPSGGSRLAQGTIVLPARRRVLIGVDDTDTKERGATWTLVHNIAKHVCSKEVVYLSHTIVQLFPVPEKTQNCTATVVELGCTEDAIQHTISSFERLLIRHSLSEEVGMAVWVGFGCDFLREYSARARSHRVSWDEALQTAHEHGVLAPIEGRGFIGALAALPHFADERACIPMIGKF